MTNQYVWIGVFAGVFFAGLGIGYAIFMNTSSPVSMMQNPQTFNQMMSNNPQFTNSWMKGLVIAS